MRVVRRLFELVVRDVETLSGQHVLDLGTAVRHAHRLVTEQTQRASVKEDEVADFHEPQGKWSLEESAAGPGFGIPEPGRIHRAGAGVQAPMLGPWLEDLDSLEAISQNDDARKIFLRMAAMSHDGRLPNFLAEVARDDELDDATKGQLAELASDRAFLLAVEDYLRKTQRVH